MRLDNTLLKEFAKVTNDKPERKKESTMYGTVVEQDGKVYVQLDGSDILTPVEKAMDAITGDRVVVMIKNHQAVITGNITSPASARKNTYIKTINDTLLLYGMDAVGIRSDSQIGSDIYRAEVVVNTETVDDPLIQLQTYKVGDVSSEKVLRISLKNGLDIYKFGSVQMKGSIAASTSKQFTATFSKVPTNYKLVGIFYPQFTVANHPDADFGISGMQITSSDQIKLIVSNYDLYTADFTIDVTWLAFKDEQAASESEVINLPS